ncbi:MAG TPA: nickel-binding protein, partial [Chthoniobacterales bacterium]|nr:nickel-binding protein [Chthoniobacterales bacterium]
MPTYMDIHDIPGGVSAEDVAKAHAKDVEVQDKYGVHYHKYWVNEKEGKVFCLCDAPNAEAAVEVHRQAHGLLPEKLIQVQSDVAELFLGGSEVNPAGAVMMPDASASDDRDPGIRTILFTDIVESTAMTRQLGDEIAMELIDLHDSIVRDALKELGGREVKHLGDGIMASFVSAASAVKCATRVQSEIAKHSRANTDRPIRVRVGIAAGEPVERHNDLFGVTVQLASRLCSHAQAEQILVSNVVAELCQGKVL